MSKVLLFLPTWLIIRAVCPFLKPGHPFRNRPPTLRGWPGEATETAQVLSVMIWASSFGLAILLFNALYPW